MSLFKRSHTVVAFCGRLACVFTTDGRFLALGGIENAERTNRGRNRHDVSFLVTADGVWVIGGQPKKQMLASEKKRRRSLRASL